MSDFSDRIGLFTNPSFSTASLAEKLIPTVDKLRDIRVKLGFRRYKVRIIRTAWTGGFRGQGEERIVSSVDILPVPLVNGLDSLVATMQPVGKDEVGNIKVTEISGTYSEQFLLGLVDGKEPDKDTEVFYEVEFLPAGGGVPTRRRFTIDSAPQYDALKWQWTVTLTKASPDRKDSGNPSRDGDL